VFEGTLATVVLIVFWAGAVGGVVFSIVWIDAPTWLAAVLYVALGSVAVITFPALADRLGAGGMSLVVLGGVFYTVGAVIYARQRPDPSPAVFGYHEIFHVLVTGAALLHFLAIALFVLPVA
jgi:hemolysin III